VNLAYQAREHYELGFPAPGSWRLRLNSDWEGYSRGFGNQASADVLAEPWKGGESQGNGTAVRDGFPASATISIGPYSVLIYSQDP
jgi:1,4-alpha-glucan branching enzyme